MTWDKLPKRFEILLDLIEGEKDALRFFGIHVFSGHQHGGGIDLRRRYFLSVQQPVGGLHAQIADGVGVLDHQGVHFAGFQHVHGDYVAVEGYQTDALGGPGLPDSCLLYTSRCVEETAPGESTERLGFLGSLWRLGFLS